MSDQNNNTNAATIEQAKKSPVSNPVTGAISYGLGCAAFVALGAAVRGHSVHDEAMTVLIGGVICGAIAGLLGSILLILLPQTFAVAEYMLQLAALLVIPFVGHQSHTWAEFNYVYVLIDILIGSAIIAGGVCALVSVIVFVTTFCFKKPILKGSEPLMKSDAKNGQVERDNNANRV